NKKKGQFPFKKKQKENWGAPSPTLFKKILNDLQPGRVCSHHRVCVDDERVTADFTLDRVSRAGNRKKVLFAHRHIVNVQAEGRSGGRLSHNIAYHRDRAVGSDAGEVPRKPQRGVDIKAFAEPFAS